MARYLLLLNDLDDSPDLIAAAQRLKATDRAAEFVLLVPALNLGPFDAWLLPYTTSRQRARARAQRMRSAILGAGLNLTAARLGNSSALRALEDALRFTDYAAVVIASPAHPHMHRLRLDLGCRAAARFPRTKVIHANGGLPRSSRLGDLASSGPLANQS